MSGDPRLAGWFPQSAELGRLLLTRGRTVAVAESCTGGLLGAALTAVPGSSRYVRGGVVAYADSVKRELLGVDGQLLATRGAVSAEVAAEMARGVARTLDADLGISITGVAGPGAEGTAKPVGLIYVAGWLAGRADAAELREHGDREANRAAAVRAALLIGISLLTPYNLADVSSVERPAPRSAADFHFGAEVYSSDGRHLGALSFVIVDGESFGVHAIVVEETPTFSGHRAAGTAMVEDDIAIPVGSIGDVERDRITLTISSAAARRAEPYLTYRYAPLRVGDTPRLLAAQAGETGVAPELVEEAHKRLDELEIRRGENVMLGRTGEKLGTVRDVIVDAGELVGVVVHPVGFFTEDVLLQTRFLGRSDDLALFAHVSQTDLDHLTPFHPRES